MDETERSTALGAFIGQRRQMMREVRQDSGKRHRDEVASRQKANANIAKHFPGLLVTPGDLEQVKKTSSNRDRHNSSGRIKYEKLMGPWKVSEVIQLDLSLEVIIQGGQLRRRRVVTSAIK